MWTRFLLKELLTNLASLAVVVPDWKPLITEDPENNLVVELTIPEDMLAETTFNFIPTV